MSTGPGHIQRAIIGRLTHWPYASSLDLVIEAFGLDKPGPIPTEPTKAQINSVNRALRRLRERGMLEETARWDRKGYRLWVIKQKPITHASISAKLRTQKPKLVEVKRA